MARCLAAVALLSSLVIAPHPAACQTSIAYSGVLPDADGISRSVTFSGRVDGLLLSGRAIVEGNALDINGVLSPDGSVSGTVVVVANGQTLGTFEAMSDGRRLSITYFLGGRSGTVSTPLTANVIGTSSSTQ
jgi:hypothetical protein